MVELGGSLGFFFEQIKTVLQVVLPLVRPFALIGFIIYIAYR